MRSKTRNKSKFSACGLATVLLGASLALAKSYDIACDTQSLAADGADRTVPILADDKDERSGHEERVQVSSVVASDGAVIDKT